MGNWLWLLDTSSRKIHDIHVIEALEYITTITHKSSSVWRFCAAEVHDNTGITFCSHVKGKCFEQMSSYKPNFVLLLFLCVGTLTFSTPTSIAFVRTICPCQPRSYMIVTNMHFQLGSTNRFSLAPGIVVLHVPSESSRLETRVYHDRESTVYESVPFRWPVLTKIYIWPDFSI